MRDPIDFPTQIPRGPSPAEKDPRKRFPIDVRMTSLPAMTSVAWKAIEAANDPPQWFTVGNDPVRIIEDPNEPPHTERLGMDALGNLSARTAFWFKNTEKDGDREQFPLERVLRNMLADAKKPLPPLRRVTRAPVFAPDASLALRPGYHEPGGIYYSAGKLVVDSIPDEPSDDDIAWAKQLIFDELLVDFPFVSQAERANALSLMLNPFVRDLIDGPTPMYLIEAPAAGTGKGLLAHMLLYPALGSGPVLMPPSSSEEETRKRLTSTLMDIPEAVLIDNVARGLDSPSLAAVLTTQMWHDRMLGRSETKAMPVRCTWIATGNNPTRSNEMSRRLVRIRLDSQAERPEERQSFRHRRLDWWAADNRHLLVRACLLLVQRWIALEAPLGNTTLGSFEAWSSVHSGLLESVGVEGFMGNKRAAEEISRSDDAAWQAFVEAWWDKHHAAGIAASELFPIAAEIDDFPLGKSPSERGQRTAFGMALKANRDRVFNGLRIVYAGTYNRAAVYKLYETSERP